MADSVAAGLADENETENEDKEREKRLFSGVRKTEEQAAASDLTETLGFYERKAKCKERKSNVSGTSDRQRRCALFSTYTSIIINTSGRFKR